jgi:putative two-component system response regulator
MPPALLDAVLRRALLVALLVGGVQALVLAFGWLLIYQYTHERVAGGVEEVIVQANVAAAEAVIESLGGVLEVGEFGSPQWERAQAVVEKLELGGGGFACVLDDEGLVLCHPDIRGEPGLRSVNLGAEGLMPLAGGEGTPLSQINGAGVVTGMLEHPIFGKHYIATRRTEGGDARLLIHQPVSGLEAASRQVTRGLVGRMRAVGGAVVALTVLLALAFLRAHYRALPRWNQNLEATVVDRTAELLLTHRAILFGIAKLSEYRDNETRLHVERICAYSATLAREMQRRGAPVDDQWIEDIELAASLHDIGKVGIPDTILLKPGRLTVEEFAHMKHHAAIGEETLRAVRERISDCPLLDMGVEIAGGHHEHWDGGGYPRGLCGEAIPLSARIVALADVFDALMSKRVYKPAFPFDEVEMMIEKGRGTHFDPAVVDAFVAVAPELLAIRRRMNDETGSEDFAPAALPSCPTTVDFEVPV